MGVLVFLLMPLFYFLSFISMFSLYQDSVAGNMGVSLSPISRKKQDEGRLGLRRGEKSSSLLLSGILHLGCRSEVYLLPVRFTLLYIPTHANLQLYD